MLVGCVVIVVLIASYRIPSYKVIAGYDLPDKDYQWLVENEIIKDGELIEFFYSDGLFDIHDEGNILTSNRLVSYERIEGELAVYQAGMDELQGYDFYPSGSVFDDSWLDITTFREAEPLPGEKPDESVIEYESFSLLLSPNEGGDIQLVKALKEKLAALGWFPVAEVLPKEKVPLDYIGWMREQNILKDYETLLYFYSAGRHSIAEDGNILTDKRLISYYQDENEDGGFMNVLSVPYNDIVNYEITMSGTDVSDTRLYVHTVENGFFIYLSPKNHGDAAFIDELVRRADIQPQHLLEANKEE
ncbi:hypothetical protein K8I31_19980 [bacterium]|nr:hypothetical protein [bacterium]